MITFELRHLRYFLAVAEELHFSRAAKRLNIAQPPLSQAIRQLETLIGTKLFERNNRKVELTPAGAAFVQGARLTLEDAERSADSARRAGRGESASLRIGFSDSAALSVLPLMVRRFHKSHPQVHLELSESVTQAQLDAVVMGRIDVALVRGPVRPGDLRVDVLLRERFVAVIPKGHALARHKGVSLKTIAAHPVVLFPRHLAPDFHDLLLGMFRKVGAELRVSYEAAEYQTILSLVAAGLGISIVPSSVQNLARADVVYRKITDATVKAEVVAVYFERKMTRALSDLLQT